MPQSMSTDAAISAEPHWRLNLCGRAQAVSARGERFVLERRDAAMLALLAIDGPTPRARVMALLWPDDPVERVRNRLRQRIFALKRRLGAEAVVGSLTLALGPALQWQDDESAERPLLGDDDHADLPELAQWLAIVRERQQVLRRERLAGEASALEQQGRLAEAIVAAERLLVLEPLQEHAHRRLMRLHYLRGDRAAALLAFDRCERLLKDEIGTRPSGATLELLAQIDSVQAVAPSLARRVVPATVLRPPRLIGRDAEWARMQAAWQHGEAIVVIGEGGMGKTRLIGDLVRAQASAPGSVLQLSARPGDERVPYALLGRLLRGWLATRTAPLPAGVEAELARLLPELPQRGKHADDAGASARFVGAIESTLRDAVAAGLEAVALDDLHFADAASIEMAQHLTGTAGLRWLAAFRAAEIAAPGEALVDTLVGRQRAEPIVLRPLTRAQVAELVGSLGIEGLDVPALADTLHQRSGGNPMFLLETLKSLLLSDEPGASDARALARLPTEGNALRLIERRIGQLSRDAVRLARCAAIAGQDFSAALAARVLDVNPLDLADAWHELESAQVLRDGAFAHDLIFEAARASVPEPIARELHKRLAHLLQDDGADPARLAAHWFGAGMELQAAHCLVEASRSALRSVRHLEAFECMQRAYTIYGQLREADARYGLIHELIALAVHARSYEAAVALTRNAVAESSAPRHRSMANLALANLLGEQGDYAAGRAAARAALEAAQEAGDEQCAFGARCVLSDLLAVLGEIEEAEGNLRAGESWVHAQGSIAQQLTFAESLAALIDAGERPALAIDRWNAAIELARRSGQNDRVPTLLAHRAGTFYGIGKSQEARDGYAQSLQMLGDLPDHSPVLRALNTRLLVVDRTVGNYASAIAIGERVLADPDASRAERDDACLLLAQCFNDMGQGARATRLLDQAESSQDDSPAQIAMLELRADLSTTREQTDAARRAACAAATLALEINADRRRMYGAWRVLARFAVDDSGNLRCRHALDYAAGAGMAGLEMVFASLLAQRLVADGEHAAAARMARDAWQRLSAVPPQGLYRVRVWSALVEALQRDDPDLAEVVANTACAWIYRTAADHVPPPFRESFLHRNPANACLLAKVRER